MKKLLFLTVVVMSSRMFAFSGCSTAPLCSAVTSLSTAASNWAVANCGCPQATTYSTVFKLLNVGGLCQQPPMGGDLPSAICSEAVMLLAGFGNQLALSASGCTNVLGASCLGGVASELQSTCSLLQPADVKRL